MVSRSILTLGAVLAGLCGCSTLLNLDQFNGASLASSDDSGALDDSADNGDDVSGDDGAATADDSAPDVAIDAMETGSSDALDGGVDARDGAADSTSDALEAAAGDATREGAPGDARLEAAPGDATLEAAPNDASTGPDVVDSGTDAVVDATLDAGAGADADAADAGPTPVVSFTWDNAALGTGGWSAHGWNILGGGGQGTAIGACVTSELATDGYPSPGCLSITIPFTATNQAVALSVIPGIIDIRGKTISFYMKLNPPLTTSEATGGGWEYLINFSDVNWGWSATIGIPIPPAALLGTWAQVSTPVDGLPNLMDDAGTGGTNNPAEAHQFGIWIETVGGSAAIQTTTVLIDSFVVQ